MRSLNHSSRWAFLIVTIVLSVSFWKYSRWDNLIIPGGDPWGYYMYLPATFIHHDLDKLDVTLKTRGLHGIGATSSKRNPLGIDESFHLGDGKQVVKYTSGLAILYSPFFMGAHLYAKMSDTYAADGFSLPYIMAISLSTLFFALLGLWVLRNILLRFFSENIVALTILSLALATNLYSFSAQHLGMAHTYLFTLHVLLLYASMRFFEDFNWKHAVGIGLAAGFITLIRPVEILCLLIPLLYGIHRLADVPERGKLIRQHLPKVLTAVGVFVLCGVPQLIYWKWATGHWVHYSYGNEGFDFLNPLLKKGLVGFKNGWLIYTPIMVFSLVGFFTGFRKNPLFWVLVILLPLHIYIIYSWWNWQYINGFGSRPMVDLYGLLAFPLAACFAWMSRYKLGIGLLAVAFVFFSWLNLFQTYQFSKLLLFTEDGNWAYYQSTFGKDHLTYRDLAHFDTGESQPDPDDLAKVRTIHYLNFEDSLNANYVRIPGAEGDFAYKLTLKETYGPTLSVKVSDMQAQAYDWLRISAKAYKETTTFNIYDMSNMVASFEHKDKTIKWRALRIDNKLGNHYHFFYAGTGGVWEDIHFWTQVPSGMKGDAIFKCYPYTKSPHPVFLDEIKVEVWRK